MDMHPSSSHATPRRVLPLSRSDALARWPEFTPGEQRAVNAAGYGGAPEDVAREFGFPSANRLEKLWSEAAEKLAPLGFTGTARYRCGRYHDCLWQSESTTQPGSTEDFPAFKQAWDASAPRPRGR